MQNPKEHDLDSINLCYCGGMSEARNISMYVKAMENIPGKLFLMGELSAEYKKRLEKINGWKNVVYFDYFSNHPLVGLGGMIPRWLIHIPNYYENISYPMEIGKMYFNEPDMYCNTGFLAEEFMRFGYIGIILILVLFAMILLQIDVFQKRVGFRMAIGFFIHPIYSLVDAHLIDSFILGPWMALEIILLFYTQTDWKDYELLLQKSKRIIKRTMGIFKKQ